MNAAAEIGSTRLVYTLLYVMTITSAQPPSAPLLGSDPPHDTTCSLVCVFVCALHIRRSALSHASYKQAVDSLVRGLQSMRKCESTA